MRDRTKFGGDRSNCYGEFSIFQDGGRRHLGFSKFLEILTVEKLKRLELRRRAKFRGDRSNRS